MTTTATTPAPSGASSGAPSYSPGLAGVVAGESAISAVDGESGLLYRGYDIHELAVRASFDEVIYLLLHGELPNATELEKTQKELADDAPLPGAVKAMLRLMPPRAHPIDAVRTGLSMLASFDPELDDISHAANMRKAMRIIARTSTLITASHRIASGQEPFSPPEHLTFAGRFLFGMTGKEPQPWQIGAMNLVFTMYAEHEFNASTFAARVTASTLSDIYSAAVTGLGALKGPLHGGANEEAMKMIKEIGTPDRAEAWVKAHLARKGKIMGFGHRVYKKGDSRVPAMRDLSRELGRRLGHEQLVDVCVKLEEVMAKEKGLFANLDLYAAPALHLLGIPPELDVPVFAAARMAGWCAHVIEQHDHNRLIRPRSIYTGPAKRAYPGAH